MVAALGVLGTLKNDGVLEWFYATLTLAFVVFIILAVGEVFGLGKDIRYPGC